MTRYNITIIANQDNSDIMIKPEIQHTTNPVPFFFISPNNDAKVKDGRLGDLAPSFLKWKGVDTPEKMTGDIIIEQI